MAQAAAAQKQATDGTADAMRAVAAAVQRNAELLAEVVARLPAPPSETSS